MRNVVLSVDIEEWYHLDYLQKYNLEKKDVTVPLINEFLDMLDKHDIKTTFFVLGELAYKYKDILQDISERGHEIASHGYDHTILHKMSNNEFKYDIEKSKDIIENVINKTVIGYRAPCFSLDNDKLEILKNSAYLYDSSYIRFSNHPLYGELDLTEFKQVDDLIYFHNNFYEFELPTKKIWGQNIPISGGGYLRLFPNFLNKYFINSFLKRYNNFFFYLHPFELTDTKLPFPAKTSLKDQFRASVGRKGNLEKLKKIISSLKDDHKVNFTTFSSLIKSKET